MKLRFVLPVLPVFCALALCAGLTQPAAARDLPARAGRTGVSRGSPLVIPRQPGSVPANTNTSRAIPK